MAVEDVPFSISLVGDSSGETFKGEFRAKIRLSLRDQLNRDKIRRDMLGSNSGQPDDRAVSIAIIQSEIRPRLTKMPKWFEESDYGMDLDDGNVLGAVYDEVMKAEKEAKDKRDKAAKEAEEALRKEQSENKSE